MEGSRPKYKEKKRRSFFKHRNLFSKEEEKIRIFHNPIILKLSLTFKLNITLQFELIRFWCQVEGFDHPFSSIFLSPTENLQYKLVNSNVIQRIIVSLKYQCCLMCTELYSTYLLL